MILMMRKNINLCLMGTLLIMILKKDEEHGLDMLYDNALDDGPMIIDNPPCLVVTTVCEDKNDILAACDNTLTHESPTLFLKSPIDASKMHT